jgi:UDP-N-acetylmuramoyl-L-alanyl-D-glutamate--2,6-diaminopimelate ligase
MKLKKLFEDVEGVEIRGSKEIEIKGLCNHSKLAAPGFLFFAKKGGSHNGAAFCQEAIFSGVLAIATDLFNPFLQDVTQIICPDVAKLESIIANKFYLNPSKELLTIGITGTNGKTTCSYLIKHILDALDCPAGLIGTVEWIVKDAVFPSQNTTPDQLTTQKLLREMRIKGCKSAVMEVSSHALDQERVRGIEFDVAVFTNLTQDHLDYHESMEAYAQAKAKLFAELKPGKKKYPKIAVLNKDSPWSPKMQEHTTAFVITYGFSDGADVRAEDLHLSPEGSFCKITYKGKTLPFHSKLIGKFNIYNCLASLAVFLAFGWDFAKILEILSNFTSVKGRLERVENPSGKHIFVDYGHTEDALQNVLQTLKEVFHKGRIFCVFGCGGNRDPFKRPKMGRAAEIFADRVFVTSDNPRGEKPEEIIKEILSGMQSKKNVQVEVDRRKAIFSAICELNADDVLLIAGKGHENYQIFSDRTIHFDDRIVAKEYSG